MAQWLSGEADGIAFCRTSDGSGEWYNHWVGTRNGRVADISGVYFDEASPREVRYKDWDFGPHMWPSDYSKEDVRFWYDVLMEARK